VKRAQSPICNRPIFKELNHDLYDFANEVRTAVREAIDACVAAKIEGEDAETARLWAITLGPLMYDVSGSVLLLLSHGHRRGPVMLNRSIFEYQIRLRYYAKRPDKAREAISQMPERFKRIMRADPTWRAERSEENRALTDTWLKEREKIARENFKEQVLRTVVGDDTEMIYDAYYGKASAWVHGYETVIRDVHRGYYNEEDNPQIDYKGKVCEPNDAAGILTHNLLYGLEALLEIVGDMERLAILLRRWYDLQKRLDMLPNLEAAKGH
jgi:hypothetical protein